VGLWLKMGRRARPWGMSWGMGAPG